MMYFVRTVSIKRADGDEKVRNYRKILFVQNIVESGRLGDTYPTSPPGSAPGC